MDLTAITQDGSEKITQLNTNLNSIATDVSSKTVASNDLINKQPALQANMNLQPGDRWMQLWMNFSGVDAINQNTDWWKKILMPKSRKLDQNREDQNCDFCILNFRIAKLLKRQAAKIMILA